MYIALLRCKAEKWYRTFVRGTVRTENEIVSVCDSVFPQFVFPELQKWFKPFVRGTFETETSLLTFELIRSTIWKKVDRNCSTVELLHFSNVSIVRPLRVQGAAPSSAGGGPQPFYAFKCCLSQMYGNQMAATNLQFVCPPPAAQPQAHNLILIPV